MSPEEAMAAAGIPRELIESGDLFSVRSQSGALRDLLSRLRSVTDTGHILLDGDPPPYADVVRMACEKMKASIGLLFIYKPEDKLLTLAASEGLEALSDDHPPRVGLGQGLSGWVAQNRMPVVVNDILRDGRFGSTSFLKYKRLSAISIPILHKDDVLGVLTLCDERPGAFGAADLLTCEAMAVSLAFGLRCNSLRSQVHANYLSTVQGLANALEAKDQVTQGHSLRIAHMCREIARVMDLDRATCERTETAARLHDIGKIGIPDAILRKPVQLTPEDWSIVTLHPVVGAEILTGIPALEPVARIVLAHHERLDGAGYPHGLRGDEIPLESRVITVADAFDAMVMGRPYRAALSTDEALKELRDCSGSQFDPSVVQALEKVLEIKAADHFYGDPDARRRST